MSKYDTLTKYLVESNKEEIVLKLDEIETILGFTLMKSARKYPFIWSDGHGSPFSNSWLKAGYRVKRTGEREQVCFTKVGSPITKRNKPIQRRFKQYEPILDIDEAASKLIKISKNIDTTKKPSVLMIVTGGDLAYQRADGVYVVPIGCLKP